MINHDLPKNIEVIGAKQNNLKNIDVNIPLNQFVAIVGVSGSGKSSLAMDTLYAEGSRRYLASLSTYTRRRISQVKPPNATEIKHIPSSLALKQRPTIPGPRSTVGTMSEVNNVLRLIYSRLGSPRCPNGHQIPPSLDIAEAMDRQGHEMGMITCPIDGVKFRAFSAEDFAFNSDGACPTCHGLGEIRTIDPDKLISDPNLSIKDGAVASWRMPGRNFMPNVAAAAGIDIDIPFKDLPADQKEMVMNGPRTKYEINIPTKTGRVFHMDNAVFENATNAITDSLKTTKSELALKRLDKFYTFSICPTCHGSRLNPDRLTQLIDNQDIAEAQDLQLSALPNFLTTMQNNLPANMHDLSQKLIDEFLSLLNPLLKLGLDYLILARDGATLSTGELQRIQLARTLRTETTGVLYVLDEPSVGLHPDNINGLIDILQELVNQGNSLVVVDHKTSIIERADWIVEIGPHSGENGGQVIAEGTVADVKKNKNSLIAPFLNGSAKIHVRKETPISKMFDQGTIHLEIGDHFNIHNLKVDFPVGKMTSVTGFSGAGKTSMVLDSLVPAINNDLLNEKLPKDVIKIGNDKIKKVVTVDASPVGKNARSTIATYTNILDELRKLYASLPESKKLKYTSKYFSYNNPEGACPTCHGLGYISLDIQYLPDMNEVCPTCKGTRYNPKFSEIKWNNHSIIDIMNLYIDDAVAVFSDNPKILKTIKTLQELGLGYLKIGEATPSLSGGEAQRLKLSNYLHNSQKTTLFIFDEPTVGLHPLDIQNLIQIFQMLLEHGATILAITHDLDMMVNSDYIVDMGPRGGDQGGQIVAVGDPAGLIKKPDQSLTIKYLNQYWQQFTK